MKRYDIERNPQWDRTDAYVTREFVVYVLSTAYGQYVGHTGDLTKRLSEHTSGKVQSTYGGRPKLIWKSKPFHQRDDAAEFERALKVLRDRRDAEYGKLINAEPEPWKGAWKTAERRHFLRGRTQR